MKRISERLSSKQTCIYTMMFYKNAGKRYHMKFNGDYLNVLFINNDNPNNPLFTNHVVEVSSDS